MSISITKTLWGRSAYLWVVLVTALVLMLPLVAMQFTEEVNWGAADFIVMAALLLGLGSSFVLVSRNVRGKRRGLVYALLTALFLFLWAELAVGIFTDLGS